MNDETAADPVGVADTLAGVAATLPGGGEMREGQAAMAEAVARALAAGRHLVVQAGTGTGKSLAYLVPVALAGRRVVVATATKALQDQLAGNDLPLVAASLEAGLSFAVLKGRSNYLCRQRVLEVGGGGDQLTLTPGEADPPDADDPLTPSAGDDTPDGGRLADQVRRLVRWADRTDTGDRAELAFEPHFRAWAAVSTTARECPGAYRCPSGRDCFAEEARNRAAAADVVVVNTHLYGAHLASGGAVLPPHEVLVLDEAHEVEEVMTDSLGVEIGPGRFRALAATTRPLLDGPPAGGAGVADDVAEVGDRLQLALAPLAGRRLDRLWVVGDRADTPAGAPADGAAAGADPGELARVLSLGAGRVERLVDALHRSARQAGDPSTAEQARRDRALLAAGHLATDLARLTNPTDDEVVWVDGGPRATSLRLSPIDVGPLLAEQLWGEVTGVLTSATVPLGLTRRLGLPAADTDELDVGSPFDYPHRALLYVARSLPDRRKPESEPALHDELEALITAAGGRTLALFTSWRAMRAAVEALTGRLRFPVLSQSDRPKAALLDAFTADEATCLFATLGFWQGVDVPGRTLSLVTIDRIPFPRPDDPILEARRERAGSGSFGLVDLPRAGTLLAQGAGRLIRRSTDRGVVAVLDSRLATARYRGDLLARVPPMRRTLDRGQVETFLRRIAEEPDPFTTAAP
jgi:ATP-dependent DNA helicase DinG